MAGPGCPGRDERMVSLEKECGDISASQEELLARSSFLGGDEVESECADIAASHEKVELERGDISASQAAYFLGGGREKVELECGDISASQEELLARSSFLGGEAEAEVFSTPPLTQEDHQQQQQEEEEEEDAMSMRRLPVSQPSPWADESDASKLKLNTPRKPRVCTRKVRGARIRTPTPSPDRSTTNATTSSSSIAVDPLCRAVLMIPTRKTSTNTPAASDILALARERGIF